MLAVVLCCPLLAATIVSIVAAIDDHNVMAPAFGSAMIVIVGTLFISLVFT